MSAGIVQYWHDAWVMPDQVSPLVESFRTADPGVGHRLFDEPEAERFIADRFEPRHVAAFRSCAVAAMQADYFRYCAILDRGGLYADADLRCLASPRPLLEHSGPTLFGRPELPVPWQTPEYQWRERVGPYRVVMNSFFAFPQPGHPLLELVLEVATANVERRISENVGIATGPGVLTSLYLLHQLGSLDAFLDYSRGGVLSASAPLLAEVVGDHARVGAAFGDVRILPFAELFDWARAPAGDLAYKDTAAHWVNVTTSIYR